MAEDRKAGDAGGRHRSADRRIGDFGSKLREARERKGVSLREIATATKISVRALEALERNDISHLPGGIFSRAFVRAYAAEAGLNPDETVDAFVQQFPHDSVVPGHPAATGVNVTGDESNRRTARVATQFVGLGVALAALVFYFAVAARPASSVATEAMAASAAPAESTTGRIGVEVTAVRPCRLTAGVDGQPTVDIPLEAGGRQSFDAQTELTLTVSDPSAVELRINGRLARNLGAGGGMTTVHLTPANYQTFVAEP